MTREELAHEIAVGLIETGVEGVFESISCSTAGDYPSIGISQWEGPRADKLLSTLGLNAYIGKSYSYLNSHNMLNPLSNILDSSKGRQAQLKQLENDCLIYVDTLWETVETLDQTLPTIYAGIWCPTSHYVVSKFLRKKEQEGFDLRNLEVVRNLFRDQYAQYAYIPSIYYAGYRNRANNTYEYVKKLNPNKVTEVNY